MARKCRFISGVNLRDSDGRAEQLRGELVEVTGLDHGGVCREDVRFNREVQLPELEVSDGSKVKPP